MVNECTFVVVDEPIVSSSESGVTRSRRTIVNVAPYVALAPLVSVSLSLKSTPSPASCSPLLTVPLYVPPDSAVVCRLP